MRRFLLACDYPANRIYPGVPLCEESTWRLASGFSGGSDGLGSVAGLANRAIERISTHRASLAGRWVGVFFGNIFGASLEDRK